ncbi:TetR/AcrR family transcriptional regulator [Clostridium sp.]|uniref:TetR/AcrR family transcriptional regulator n=1 Tax=Clostridium sp. TaxID=1506 RepID=UPI002852274A|nr:TetR/AcrR family transcriptional regulator [Clostridium sp.]MDR3598180.1 TetR/AcrR family transcriptional regulator [Clostridium sp.]
MKRLDNNSQNKLVKECIFSSLMILMEKKNFQEISITDITNKAGVSRMAYYRNYKSKEDIITNYLDELFEAYLNEITNYEKIDTYQFTYMYFVYFRRHKKLITNLIKANLSILILERFDKYLHLIFEEILHNDSSEKISKYEINYIAGGLYKVLIQWIDNGLEESDENMAKTICSFANK